MAKKEPLCRYFRKPCIKEDCVQYVRLDGIDPQTAEPINAWMCVDIAQLKIQMETTMATRRVDGELNVFRNDMVSANARAFALVNDVPALPSARILELPHG